jgi:hypothetical protein
MIVLPKGRSLDDYGKADLDPKELFDGFMDGSISMPGRTSHLRLVIDNTKSKERDVNANKITRE